MSNVRLRPIAGTGWLGRSLDSTEQVCEDFGMFWIALAAQVSAPLPMNPGFGFSGDDVPEYLLRAGPGLWQVPIRVTVAPDGKVRGCDVEITGGIADLNKLTCRIVARRARFKAAEIDGVPIFGIFRTSIKWAVADAPWDTSKVINADIDLSVSSLPAGVESPTSVEVAFLVDASGRKSSCAASQVIRSERVNNHPALVPIACDQIMKLYQATPATDEEGTTVPSVQNAKVQISVAASK